MLHLSLEKCWEEKNLRLKGRDMTTLITSEVMTLNINLYCLGANVAQEPSWKEGVRLFLEVNRGKARK